MNQKRISSMSSRDSLSMRAFANKDNCLSAFGKTVGDQEQKPKKARTTFVTADPRWIGSPPDLETMFPSSVKVRKVGGIVRQIECPSDLADSIEDVLRKRRMSFEEIED